MVGRSPTRGRSSARSSGSSTDSYPQRRPSYSSTEQRPRYSNGRSQLRRRFSTSRPRAAQPWMERDVLDESVQRDSTDQRNERRHYSNPRASGEQVQSNKGPISPANDGSASKRRQSNTRVAGRRGGQRRQLLYPVRFVYLPPGLCHPAALNALLRQHVTWHFVVRCDMRFGEAVVEFPDEASRQHVLSQPIFRQPFIIVDLLPPLPIDSVFGRRPGPRSTEGPRNGRPPLPTRRPYFKLQPTATEGDNSREEGNNQDARGTVDLDTLDAATTLVEDLNPVAPPHQFVSQEYLETRRQAAEVRQRKTMECTRLKGLLKKFSDLLKNRVESLSKGALFSDEADKVSAEIQLIRSKMKTLSEMVQNAKATPLQRQQSQLREHLSAVRTRALSQHVPLKCSSLGSAALDKYNLDMRTTTVRLTDLPAEINSEEALVDWMVGNHQILLSDGIETLRFVAPNSADITYVTRKLAETVVQKCAQQGTRAEFVKVYLDDPMGDSIVTISGTVLSPATGGAEVTHSTNNTENDCSTI